MRVEIHYRSDEIRKMYQRVAGSHSEKAAGYDLVLCEDLVLSQRFQFVSADLGIILRPPPGYHSLLLPRSSTFMRYQLMLANSVGLIDEDYCGEGDYWRAPLLYLGSEELKISKGTRLCQFVLSTTYPVTEAVEFVPGSGRGGFGSTGV